MALVYYNPSVVTHDANLHLPGMAKFSFFFKKLFGASMVIVDRTNTISIPVKIRPLFPIPSLKPQNKSFEEICNERATELLDRADNLGVTLYVAWSGGIDSTLVLVSLLKNATARQKKNIVVLLSEESMAENPRFYKEHIRGKLKMEPSAGFPYILGSTHIFVNGEFNDQLFGAAAPNDLMLKFGDSIIHQPYRRDLLFSFLNENVGNAGVTNFYLDLFDRIMHVAPISITTYFDYFWWINFTLKWQSVFMRVVSFTAERNAHNITPEYIHTNYAPFYGTEDFQLWSMNNLDKRIKDTWSTYKWPCKDIIYDYTKDRDYRDTKIKRGSLYFILLQQNAYNFIDESMHFSREMDPAEYYNPDNDFI